MKDLSCQSPAKPPGATGLFCPASHSLTESRALRPWAGRAMGHGSLEEKPGEQWGARILVHLSMKQTMCEPNHMWSYMQISTQSISGTCLQPASKCPASPFPSPAVWICGLPSLMLPCLAGPPYPAPCSTTPWLSFPSRAWGRCVPK